MRDIRKYMDMMGGKTSQSITESSPPRLQEYMNLVESEINEAPKKTELQMMASRVLPRGAKESQYSAEMRYTKEGGLDSVATMEEKIIAKLKEAGFTKVQSAGDEKVFKLDNWVATTRVSYGMGYKYANLSATLSQEQDVTNLDEAPMSDGRKAIKSFLTANGWVKFEARKSRQGTRIWLRPRSQARAPKMSKDEYVQPLLSDLQAAGIECEQGEDYEKDSIIGSDWKIAVQDDMGVINLCLSMRDTPNDGRDW